MKIQDTYSFILILQIFMSFSAIIAIIWSLLIDCSYVPFLLLLLISIFFFVSIYISNNKFKILALDKKSCILSIFITWLLLIVMGGIPLYIIFPKEEIKDIFFLSVSLSTTSGIWTEIQSLNKPEFLIWQAILQWLGGLCTILVGSFFVEMVLRKKNIIKDYFSIRSPSFKELNIQLENLNEADVLDLMLKEPRLIRRPLIFIDGQLIIGTGKLAMSDIM